MRKRFKYTRRAFLAGVLSCSSALGLFGFPAEAWNGRREATAPAVNNWMYVFTDYASEAAAKADLAEFVSGASWGPSATGGVTVSGQSGYQVVVRTPGPRNDLFDDNANCKLELHLRSKTATRTKILPYLTLAATTITGVDASEIYQPWHTTGILPCRPLAPADSWLFQRVDGPEVFLHHNSAAIVNEIVTVQAPAADFGVNGGASGGRAFSAPVYVRADDTPLIDFVPSTTPFPLYIPASAADTFEDVICNDVPMPVGATIAGGTDREIATLDPTVTNEDFREFWQCLGTPPNLTPNRGGIMTAMTDTDLNFGLPFGAAATGLSMVHQKAFVDEVLYGPGWAEHALNLTVISATFMYSWPALRTDGATSPLTTPNKIMEGQRFRWDPTIDVDALNIHPLAKFYLKTWQRYGGMINDRGGSLGTRVENEKPAILLGLSERWPDIYGVDAFWQIFGAYNGHDAVDWSGMQILPARYGHPTWQPGRLQGLAWNIDTSNVNWLRTNSGVSFQPSNGAWDVSGNGCEIGADDEATSPDYSSTGWNSTRSGVIFYRADDTRWTTRYAKNLTLDSGTEELTVVVAFGIRTAVYANSRILSVVGAGETADDDNESSFCIRVNAAGTHVEVVRNGVAMNLCTTVVAQLQWLMVVWDGTNMTPYFNGVAGTPVASTGTWATTSDITMANIDGGGQAAECRWGFAAISGSADGNDQVSDMDTYFSSIWSIA